MNERPVYTVQKNCKYRGRPCGKCGHPLKINKKYVLDPVRQQNGLPVAYHAACWRQK